MCLIITEIGIGFIVSLHFVRLSSLRLGKFILPDFKSIVSGWYVLKPWSLNSYSNTFTTLSCCWDFLFKNSGKDFWLFFSLSLVTLSKSLSISFTGLLLSHLKLYLIYFSREIGCLPTIEYSNCPFKKSIRLHLKQKKTWERFFKCMLCF